MFVTPDLITENIFDIDIPDFEKSGIRLVILDLDSTIMESKTGRFHPTVVNWLADMQRAFHVVIVSNNKNKDYIYGAQRQVSVPIYGDAHKPGGRIIRMLMKQYDVKGYETVVVGDRPLTDILVGQRMGLRTVLVDSISKSRESTLTRFVRWLERLLVTR